MQPMTITLISVRTAKRQCHAIAQVTAECARLWIELSFEPQTTDPYAEAYDRVLALLDPA